MFPRIRDLLQAEIDEEEQSAMQDAQLVQPTPEEARNGWTAESLTRYLISRKAAAGITIDPHSLHRRFAARPVAQNKQGYRPLRWRG